MLQCTSQSSKMANFIFTSELFSLAAVVILTSIASLFTGLCVFLYLQHKKFEGFPGPPRESFFLGNRPQLAHLRALGQHFDLCVRNWSLEYGKTFVLWFGHFPLVCVVDPVDIKKAIVTYNLPKCETTYSDASFLFGQRFAGYGLITNTNHSDWRRHRLAMNPGFHRRNLKDMMVVYNEKCNDFLHAMSRFAERKEVFSMADMCQRVTMDVIAKAIFSIDFNSVLDSSHEFPHAVATSMLGIQASFALPYARFLPTTWRYQNEVTKEVRFLRNFCRERILEREQAISKGDSVPDDMLARYMNNIQTAGLDLEDMVDDILTLFLAGHETTGNTLGFMMFEIASNPHIAERIVAEVDDVLGTRQFVENDDVSKLEYITLVLKETLRRHLVALGTVRMADRTVELGGLSIPKGTSVRLSFFGMHLHPDVYPEPEVFNPERFAARKLDDSSFTFLPFSAGPRNCIGQFMAQYEAKVIVARFFQNFKLQLEPGQTNAVTERLTIYPRDGVMVTVEHRS